MDHDSPQARGVQAGIRRLRPRTVAGFAEPDVERLLADASIVRHRGKIEAAIGNAQAALELPPRPVSSCGPSRLRPGSGAAVVRRLPSVTAESTALSKELKRSGFRFVGPTTFYAFMQSAGSRRRSCRGLPTPGRSQRRQTPGPDTSRCGADGVHMTTATTPWGTTVAIEEVSYPSARERSASPHSGPAAARDREGRAPGAVRIRDGLQRAPWTGHLAGAGRRAPARAARADAGAPFSLLG